MKDEDIMGLTKWGIGIFIVFLLIINSIVIVPAGHTRVVFNRIAGVDPAPMDEGFNFKVPFIEKTYKYEIREQKDELNAAAASKDLQIVTTTIALNYHLSGAGTPELFKNVGLDYKNRIILPATQEAVKAVTANYNAEDLIRKRPEVSTGIKEVLRERLIKHGIIIDDFSIINFDFSEEFNRAIEEKQVAEQRALKAERDLERVKFEADQIREKAAAEADEIKLKAQALRDGKDVISLRQIEAQIKAIESWDGKLPMITGGSAIPLINFDSFKETTGGTSEPMPQE